MTTRQGTRGLRVATSEAVVGFGCWLEDVADQIIRLGMWMLPKEVSTNGVAVPAELDDFSGTDGGFMSPEGAHSGSGGNGKGQL